MKSIKHQLLELFSNIGKSAEDVDYYRIILWSSSPPLKGKSNNIFDFMIVLDELSNINHLVLGIIVFHDNTWLMYDSADREWDYNHPPSYNKLMGDSND